MSEARQERRRSKRVEANLKIRVDVPVPDGAALPAKLETINISSSGVYFRSDHFIEPMTKLSILLELDLPEGGGPKQDGLATVHCEGLVVRLVPEEPTPGCDSYEVAVFFTHIDPDGFPYLEEHISKLITEG